MRILLVEDEAMTVMLMKLLLRKLNHEDVQAVASGEKALALIDQWPPELVLMDILLAGKLDGIDTTIELRKRLDVPVVYTTGYDSGEVRQRAEASGAAAYLLKPVSKDDLARMISQLFPSSAEPSPAC
ncbi:MAG: hypothetical protein A2087_10115 [Spirochaetes bacterium GWD1_61_31]|nr:MAG: hypothetical protein A2Y37_01935 [Spirochaetes bacterium GWB1_60_80]OHD32035.1 MAG: hypothetical protein A2004_06335 [Spirochaetes bacterium GWC1_61_12]OHD40633.1 MAG: hypothetical protein A2087_10115 [Spirochaetes bacterium GWD1_61_31]OHD43905.1 MAG: hypothetical protein A2Y35_12465 [Spirochaetes bacterium GWE1_60_18]OHD59776.1 MAG: hypothetical protein A2Y32_02320 [Spirochaetes bacterium GWF1_60_12]HAP43497.1 response regulator [Spirochaetaceae bacterium]